jgi:hypothetical protein
MQKRRTSAGSKELTCSAWCTCAAATVSPDKRSKGASHKSVGSGQSGGEALQLKKKQIGDRALPQRGFGLGTPN